MWSRGPGDWEGRTKKNLGFPSCLFWWFCPCVLEDQRRGRGTPAKPPKNPWYDCMAFFSFFFFLENFSLSFLSPAPPSFFLFFPLFLESNILQCSLSSFALFSVCGWSGCGDASLFSGKVTENSSVASLEQPYAVHVDGESRLVTLCGACQEGQQLVIPSEPQEAQAVHGVVQSENFSRRRLS